MSQENLEQLGKLIYSRERSIFPIPGALAGGLWIALISSCLWCFILFADDGSLQQDPIPCWIVLGLLPLGLLASIVGYLQQPIFHFYENGFCVSQPERRIIPYSDVRDVEVRKVTLMLYYIVPMGTIYSLNIVCSKPEQTRDGYSCQIQRLSSTNGELDRVAEIIQSHINDEYL